MAPWSVARGHFDESDSQAPNVGLVARWVIRDNLWCHPPGRPLRHSLLVLICVSFDDFRHTEVGQFYATVGSQQNVSALDIPVNDLLRKVEIVQRSQRGQADVSDLSFSKLNIFGWFLILVH